MKCPEFRELMRWHDGESSIEETKEISHHLKSCDDCQRIMDYLSRIEEVWRDDYRDPPGAQFDLLEKNLMDELYTPKRNRRFVSAAAAVLIALLGTTFILMNRESITSVIGDKEATTPEYTEESGAPVNEGGYAVSDIQQDESEPDIPEEECTTDVLQAETGTPIEDASVQLEETEEVIASEGISTIVSDADDWEPNDACLAGEVPIQQEVSESEGTAAEVVGGYRATYQTLGSSTEAVDNSVSIDVDTGTETCSSSDSSTGGITGTSGSTSATLSPSGEDDQVLSDSSMNFACVVTGDTSVEASGGEHLYLMQDSGHVTADSLCRITLLEDGMPDSLSAVTLDSLFPRWRDYIPFRMKDTTFTVAPEMLENILRPDNTRSD